MLYTDLLISWSRNNEWIHTKWSSFHRQHFQINFLEWKLSYCDWYFIEFHSLGSNLEYICIDSDDGLALIRWQAIIWTTDDQVYWCINKYVTQPQWVNHIVDSPALYTLVFRTYSLLHRPRCAHWLPWFLDNKGALGYCCHGNGLSPTGQGAICRLQQPGRGLCCFCPISFNR